MGAPGFRLTERDCRIVHTVWEHDYLTTTQISYLFFGYDAERPRVSSRCRLRLRHLTRHGYLARIEQPTALSEGRKPYVYALDRAGADLVCELESCTRDELGWKRPPRRSPTYLAHQLAIGDVFVALTVGARAHGLAIEQWIDDRQLRRNADTVSIETPGGGRREVTIVPDAYFEIPVAGTRLRHFLEVDRATVTLTSSRLQARTWARKVRAYMAYYRSEAFRNRFGDPSTLRILVVTTTEDRARRMRDLAERTGTGRGKYLFTHQALATPTTILTGPLWWTAVEHNLLPLLSLSG